METILWVNDPTNNVIALKDDVQSTTSRANPTRFSSLKGKEKDVSKKFQYLYTTMKIEDIEAPGRQRAKPTGDKTRVYQVKLTALLLFK